MAMIVDKTTADTKAILRFFRFAKITSNPLPQIYDAALYRSFADLAFGAANGIKIRGAEEHEMEEVVQAAVFAIYRYHTEDDGELSMKQSFFRLLREVSRPNLVSKFNNDAIDITNLGTALNSKDIEEKASDALKTHEELEELHNRILVRIRYRYSAET